jgi:hypothetical protein
MIERIKNILFSPKTEWEKIKAEPTGIAQVLTGYAMPLAAIPAIFGMIGLAVIGINLGFFGTYRLPFTYALIRYVVWYVLMLAGLFLDSIVINALAPSFESKQNSVNAFKLVVYSMTPSFIAGILNIFPMLAILVFLISLYSIYLLYTGMPVMMETPKEKVVVYMIVAIVLMIVVNVLVGVIAAAVQGAFWHPMMRF